MWMLSLSGDKTSPGVPKGLQHTVRVNWGPHIREPGFKRTHQSSNYCTFTLFSDRYWWNQPGIEQTCLSEFHPHLEWCPSPS